MNKLEQKINDIKLFLNKQIVDVSNLNYDDLYEKRTDSNNIPVLKRVEKYPNLSEDTFIPVEYTHTGVIKTKNISNIYWINKKGEVKNILTDKIYKPTLNNNGYYQLGLSSITVYIHKLVSNTFLINPNPDIYKITNHINHKKTDNNLSNLNFVTIAENTNKTNGNSSYVKKVTEYVALDDTKKKELFKITVRDTKGFNIRNIINSIRNNNKSQGYYWKRKNPTQKDRKVLYKMLNYSGNINDYTWEKHSLYDKLLVCKEGFVRKIGKNNILGSISREGYLISSISRKSIRINRLLMEHIKHRKLKPEEVVDHINRNKLDNSFTNLKLTNHKGNSNNKNTINYISNKYYLIDFWGNICFYGTSKELREGYKILGHHYKHYVDNHSVLKNKYFLLSENFSKSDVIECLKNVIYVYDNNIRKFIDANYSSNAIGKIEKISGSTVIKHLNSGIYKPNNHSYLRGSEIVDKIINSDVSKVNILTKIK